MSKYVHSWLKRLNVSTKLFCVFLCSGMINILIRKWNNWKLIKVTETIYTSFQTLHFCPVHTMSAAFGIKNVQRKIFSSWNQLNNWKKIIPVFNGQRWEAVACFVDHQYLNFLFIITPLRMSTTWRWLALKIQFLSTPIPMSHDHLTEN
jgi:hypothetical protein